jgi:hypothetical protein
VTNVTKRGRATQIIPLVAIVLACSIGRPCAADEPAPAPAPTPQNLQVLPKTMTMDELKKVMTGVAASLGVKCSFCHDVKNKNYASDDLEHKQIAREMFKMVNAINTQFFADEGAQQVTCFTCHRGAAEPQHAPKAEEKKGSQG